VFLVAYTSGQYKLVKQALDEMIGAKWTLIEIDYANELFVYI
jgi:hypothetical protein